MESTDFHTQPHKCTFSPLSTPLSTEKSLLKAVTLQRFITVTQNPQLSSGHSWGCACDGCPTGPLLCPHAPSPPPSSCDPQAPTLSGPLPLPECHTLAAGIRGLQRRRVNGTCTHSERFIIGNWFVPLWGLISLKLCHQLWETPECQWNSCVQMTAGPSPGAGDVSV